MKTFQHFFKIFYLLYPYKWSNEKAQNVNEWPVQSEHSEMSALFWIVFSVLYNIGGTLSHSTSYNNKNSTNSS